MQKKVFSGLSIGMLLFAICFIVYALNNPQASFPWSNSYTYAIYIIYLVVMIISFVMSRKKAPGDK
jgi:ABC-type transport system involved in cytochrome c biogenesis permease subunit